MIIALRHPDHGVHIAYTDAEANAAQESGWKHDPDLSRDLAGQPPIEKSLVDQYREKFGKAPHHLLKKENIEKALRE